MNTALRRNSDRRHSIGLWLPLALELLAALGVVACMGGTPIEQPAAAIPATGGVVIQRPVAMATPAVQEAPEPPPQTVFERVEDYRDYPRTEATAEPGPLMLLPPDDPLMEMVRIRGVQWPMVSNDGGSRVYPSEVGFASYYHQPQKLATGERFDPRAYSAAHKTLPFGTIVRCTRADTGRSVVVMINDRGPYVKGRVIDLSPAAARELGMISRGIARCRIEVLAYPLIETMGPRGNG